MTTHTSHPDIIKRLKRAEGHLKSIIGMLEEGRGCLDIAQQLQAVESAVSSAKKTLVHDHIDHCLELSPFDGRHHRDAVASYPRARACGASYAGKARGGG
jgi:DNA-binding FrmR family transcriptional regulator